MLKKFEIFQAPMRKSLLPFVLASLGLTLILWALRMPLFEWQTNHFVSDFPPTQDVLISPSPWKAKLGDVLDDESYIYSKVHISKDGKSCIKENVDFVIRRSPKDTGLEKEWLDIYQNTTWILRWSLILIGLSILYIWWFVIWREKKSAWKAIFITIIASFIFLNLIPRLIDPFFPGSRLLPGSVSCYPGSVSFNAELLRIHCGPLIVSAFGIFLEMGALIMMFHQIRQAIVDGRKYIESE